MKEDLIQQPLNYWEIESCMEVIQKLDKISIEDVNDSINNIYEDKEIELINVINLTKENEGYIKFKYNNNEYEINFFPSEFEQKDYEFFISNSKLTEKEIKDILDSRVTIRFHMKFNKNSKESYKAQLKLMLTMFPNSISVVDESAEKSVSIKLAKMIVESKYEPLLSELYTIQAVKDDFDKVWMHTHGLIRCGMTELEILNSNIKHYKTHWNIINSYISVMMSNIKNKEDTDFGFCIGYLNNSKPIVVTHKIWTSAIKEYSNLELGGLEDRINDHNTKTSPLFIYKTEKDQLNDVVSKITDYDKYIENNPMFLYSKEDTENMKNLAQERFKIIPSDILRNATNIIAKMGVKVNNIDYEYIWGEIINIENDLITFKLNQDAYLNKEMKKDTIIQSNIKELTDWQIIYNEDIIQPTNIYLYI